MKHPPIPHPSPQSLVGWYPGPPECSRSPACERKEAPRCRGWVGQETIEGEHRTCGTGSTSVRLTPPLRQRCDGDHKNALFCRVLQKVCACMTARPVACLLSRTDALPSSDRCPPELPPRPRAGSTREIICDGA